MADDYRHSKLVGLAHGPLVCEVDIGVLVLVKNDTVAAHFLRSLNLMS